MTKSRFLAGLIALLIGWSATEIAIAETQADIIEKAKKEGSLVIYGSTSISDQTALCKAFNKRYAFIQCESIKLAGHNWTSRMALERESRQYITDVVMGNFFVMAELVRRGYVVSYNSPERSAYSKGYKDDDGFWTAFTKAYTTIIYNPDLVGPGGAPREWDDLLSPKFKYNVLVDSNNLDILGAQIKVMGEEETVAFWKKVQANGAVLTSGSSGVVQRVAAGEYAIGVGAMAHQVIAAKRDGASVEWVSTADPMPILLQAIGIVEKAPHPNSAKLFVDWLLSREGQETLHAETGRTPARSDVTTEATLPPHTMKVETSAEMVEKTNYLIEVCGQTFC